MLDAGSTRRSAETSSSVARVAPQPGRSHPAPHHGWCLHAAPPPRSRPAAPPGRRPDPLTAGPAARLHGSIAWPGTERGPPDECILSAHASMRERPSHPCHSKRAGSPCAAGTRPARERYLRLRRCSGTTVAPFSLLSARHAMQPATAAPPIKAARPPERDMAELQQHERRMEGGWGGRGGRG